MLHLILAQLAMPYWWVTPAIALGGPIAGMLFAEFIRRRNSSVTDNANVQIEQLKGMVQIREQEATARHDLRREFNALILKLTNDVEQLRSDLLRTQDGFRELYYIRQREWDHWEIWLDLLKRDNPSLVLQEDKIPHRLDTSHLAPFRMFHPEPQPPHR